RRRRFAENQNSAELLIRSHSCASVEAVASSCGRCSCPAELLDRPTFGAQSRRLRLRGWLEHPCGSRCLAAKGQCAPATVLTGATGTRKKEQAPQGHRTNT